MGKNRQFCVDLKLIYSFRHFTEGFVPKEFNLLLGVWNYRANALLKIPFLGSASAAVSFFSRKTNRPSRAETDIAYLINKPNLVIGYDRYTGEWALLSSFAQLWLKCDFLSQSFKTNARFSVFLFQFYCSKEDIRLKLSLLGCSIYVRLGLRSKS